MFLFGSNLIKKYFPDFRNPVDVDFVTNSITEYNTEYFNIIKKETELHFLPLAPNREMTPDELYTLKVSHAIYDIHWQKTMSDIRFLQNKNCKIISTIITKPKISLKQSKKIFLFLVTICNQMAFLFYFE